MDVVQGLAALGGASRWTEICRRGVSPWCLSQAVADGLVSKSGPVYHLRSADAAVIAAREFRGHVACVSACIHWGLPLIDSPAKPHLAAVQPRSLSREGKRTLDSVVFHRDDATAGLATTGTGASAILWVPPQIAVDQAGRCVSPLQQLALAEALMRRGGITRAGTRRFVCGESERRRWLCETVSLLSESVLESYAHGALRVSGLKVRQQVAFPRVGRVDLLVNDKVVVELDGREHHGGSGAFARDRWRDRALLRLGYPTLRFTYAETVHQTRGLVEEVCAALRVPLGARASKRLEWVLTTPSGCAVAE